MRLIAKVLIGLVALVLTVKVISWLNLGETIFKILFLLAFIAIALFGLASPRKNESKKQDDEDYQQRLRWHQQRENERRRRNNG